MAKNNHKEFVEPITEEVVEETPVQEVAPVKQKEVKKGVVTGCERLNVRVSPKITADVAAVINKDTEVILYDKQTNDEWYKVRVNDELKGFCMKKYITVQ